MTQAADVSAHGKRSSGAKTGLIAASVELGGLERRILDLPHGLDVRLSRPDQDARLEGGEPSEAAASALAASIGIERGAYRQTAELCAGWVEGAALATLETEGCNSLLARTPFLAGDRVVLVGDSLTADRCSWGELLAAVVPDVVVINLAVSGTTSAQALSTIDRVARAEPTWVLELLGTNDARRHGVGRHRTVSVEESRRNRRLLGDEYRLMGARSVAFGPPPIDSAAIAAWSHFSDRAISWDDDDIVGASAVEPGAVALLSASTSPDAIAWRDLLMPDGVHPSPSGHRLLLSAILASLGGDSDGGDQAGG